MNRYTSKTEHSLLKVFVSLIKRETTQVGTKVQQWGQSQSGVLLKERICSQGEQILSSKSNHLCQGRHIVRSRWPPFVVRVTSLFLLKREFQDSLMSSCLYFSFWHRFTSVRQCFPWHSLCESYKIETYPGANAIWTYLTKLCKNRIWWSRSVYPD